MTKNLITGIKGDIQTIVTKEQTAAAYGSGLVEVFATPAMIALMEKTCLRSVLEYLPDGINTVGTEVNVKHLKATAVGKNVRCQSELQKIDGKKLLFTVEAFDEQGKIGEGTHSRYVIDVKSFMEKL